MLVLEHIGDKTNMDFGVCCFAFFSLSHKVHKVKSLKNNNNQVSYKVISFTLYQTCSIISGLVFQQMKSITDHNAYLDEPIELLEDYFVYFFLIFCIFLLLVNGK
jgi:hypothetical protein